MRALSGDAPGLFEVGIGGGGVGIGEELGMVSEGALSPVEGSSDGIGDWGWR